MFLSTNEVRAPGMAGYFYPGSRDNLLQEIRRCFHDKKIGPGTSLPPEATAKPDTIPQKQPAHVECFIVPHAGYAYSGPVAAHSYSKAYELSISSQKRVTAIVLGPNHYGIGSGVALSPSAEWETPLGRVAINKSISKEISDLSGVIDTDDLAHSREHSIEVQLPFLQSLAQGRSLSIVPICLMLQDRETAEEIAETIFKVLQSKKNQDDSVLIIGSSDLTHYEPQKQANAKDAKLLDNVEKLDVLSYYSTLERNNITACGYGAIAAVMAISKRLGKKKGLILKYATSGDTGGDAGSVVGYSAVHFI